MGQLIAQETRDALTQNPWLGGSVLVVALTLLGILVRILLRSDSRWQRLNDAQADELDRGGDRLKAAEDAAASALALVHQLQTDLRSQWDMGQAQLEAERQACDIVRREVAELRRVVARLTGEHP